MSLQLFLATYVFSLCLVVSSAVLQRFEQPLGGDASLKFLVVGDWGRKGLYNQSEVAHQMGLVGQEMDINFIISTGDNFYEDGLTGVDDPAFFQSFTNIYNASSLQKPWFAGNHDYRGDVEAQLNPALRKRDRRWFCQRSYILRAGIVDFFMVDTTPFVDEYFTNPGNSTYDWSGVYPRKDYLSNLLNDLDSALKNSNAKWKIVVGHHTIFSAGDHGNTTELVKHLLPVLKENNVDIYMNGHDHCLEHIISDDSQIQFVTSGGGSKAWREDDAKYWNPKELKFFYDGQGFLSVEMSGNKADLVFYDVFGSVLHKWSILKESHFAS